MKACGRFVVFVTVLLLVGCGRAPQLGRLSDDAVIVAFGDSLTKGTGAAEEQSYPAELERITGFEVINAGVPGELSGKGLERLPGVLDKYNPSMVILCHGGNDILNDRSDDSIAANLRAMIRLCRSQSIKVMLIGVPKPKLFNMKSAAFYQEVADEMNLPLEKDILPRVLKNSKWKSDRIHPNAEGYRMMAEAVAGEMKDSGVY